MPNSSPRRSRHATVNAAATDESSLRRHLTPANRAHEVGFSASSRSVRTRHGKSAISWLAARQGCYSNERSGHQMTHNAGRRPTLRAKQECAPTINASPAISKMAGAAAAGAPASAPGGGRSREVPRSQGHFDRGARDARRVRVDAGRTQGADSRSVDRQRRGGAFGTRRRQRLRGVAGERRGVRFLARRARVD